MEIGKQKLENGKSKLESGKWKTEGVILSEAKDPCSCSLIARP
jgi:hypothetical protein